MLSHRSRHHRFLRQHRDQWLNTNISKSMMAGCTDGSRTMGCAEKVDHFMYHRTRQCEIIPMIGMETNPKEMKAFVDSHGCGHILKY